MSSQPDTADVKNVSPVSSGEMMAGLYDEVHRLAQRERWHAGRPDTLQTTAVMHEAYLRLYRREDWGSREHFLATAVTTMRHVLIDAARARLTAKRGSGESNLPLDASADIAAALPSDRDLVRLDDALHDLEQLDPKLAKLVDCRFFAGMNNDESAQVLGVTDRTVQRWWIQARAWLHSELELAN